MFLALEFKRGVIFCCPRFQVKLNNIISLVDWILQLALGTSN